MIFVPLSSMLVKGMGIIEQLDPMSFTNYLKKYRNTICGRHPIGVLLNVSTTEEETQQVYQYFIVAGGSIDCLLTPPLPTHTHTWCAA